MVALRRQAHHGHTEIRGPESMLYEEESLCSLPASVSWPESRLEDPGPAWMGDKVDGPVTGWMLKNTGLV